ncbi:MAG: hypothetical protein CSH36_03250, partial [Thalassolituus sp.]|uniref:hypothetical protein n=1 Tax=Thalassolituus sp. TaxID=2030822 RepID=UPI003514D58D
MLLTAKILITFLTVVLLAAVARRMGAAAAGVLAGFPLGSAITLYFIGAEQGTEFAAEGAVHTIAGLLGCLALASSYSVVATRFPRARQIALPVCLSVLAFLLVAMVLQYLPRLLWLCLLLTLAGILITRHLLRRIPDHPLTIDQSSFWQKPVPAILFRATAATASVLGITALAHWLTPAQAGLLSAFPVSFFPTLVVLQLSYGAPVVATTVRQYPEGLGAMVVYVVTVTWSYPAFGLNVGTALALGSAIGYLILYALARRALRRTT